MGWEKRFFFQQKPGAQSILAHLGVPEKNPSNKRTDVYWVVDGAVGVKERGAKEFVEPFAPNEFNGALDLKLRTDVDEKGFERWKVYRFQNREQVENRLRITDFRMIANPLRVAFAKQRVQIDVNGAEIEDAIIELPQLESSHPEQFTWKTVAVEGKRIHCEAVIDQVAAACAEMAVEGTLMVCGYPEFAVHMASFFPPPASMEPKPFVEPAPIEYSDLGSRIIQDNYSIVVCQNPSTQTYLTIKTAKGGWKAPGGHVNAGENFVHAANRYTFQEAGIAIKLTGVLAVEHALMGPNNARMRVIFLAEPVDAAAELKAIADESSELAQWFPLSELQRLIYQPDGLKRRELQRWAQYVESGGQVAPVSMLQEEEDGPCEELVDLAAASKSS